MNEQYVQSVLKIAGRKFKNAENEFNNNAGSKSKRDKGASRLNSEDVNKFSGVVEIRFRKDGVSKLSEDGKKSGSEKNG